MIARAAILAGAVLAGCSQSADGGFSGCGGVSGGLPDSAFVIATQPVAGEQVESAFEVRGCSRTFESTVNWELRGRDGAVLDSGFTSGGGADGPAAFAFTVAYEIDERQIGTLDVFEVDASDGEGFPPGRTVLPLVLRP